MAYHLVARMEKNLSVAKDAVKECSLQWEKHGKRRRRADQDHGPKGWPVRTGKVAAFIMATRAFVPTSMCGVRDKHSESDLARRPSQKDKKHRGNKMEEEAIDAKRN